MNCARVVALASVLMGLGSVVPARAQRAPYLQQLTPTGVSVVWRDELAEGAVCVGTAPDALTMRVDAVRGARDQHEARIAGLMPATEYWYATTDGACPAEARGSDHFRTAPVVGSRERVRMWVVGDSGTGEAGQREVRDAMLAHTRGDAPDLFLHVGDMAYGDGTDSEFSRNFFGPYEEILRHTVCWPALGNHEGASSSSSDESGPYYEAYVLPRAGEAGGLASGTEAYYAFDYANVHFVVLDSHDSPREPDGAMLTWLEADLDAADAEWIVVYFHHPPYTKGSHDSDSERRLIEMRENALPILEDYGVDLVFAGHSHVYERSYLLRGAYDTPTVAGGFLMDSGDGQVDGTGAYDANGGTVYVVAGHGGAGTRASDESPVMFFTEPERGSVIVDVSGDVLEVRNVRADGEVTDTMTMVRGAADSILLLSPVGGERIGSGDELDVRYVAPEDTLELNIELSVDGGRSWDLVAERVPNVGRHRIRTPLVRTSGAQVRLSDADRPERSARSADFELSAVVDREEIPFGSLWEYYDEDLAPPVPWADEIGEWSIGPAQFGYGDGDEDTELDDLDPNRPTVYFRTAVLVDGEVEGGEFELLFDDGFELFVNGRSVAAQNVAPASGHGDYATGMSDDNERVRIPLEPSWFEPGENVIGVRIKQVSAGSSDVSFDLRLRLRLVRDVPEVPDAGMDAGMDAGIDDAGLDGGSGPRPAEDGGPTMLPTEESGCGCRVAGRSNSFGWVAILLLAVWRRRRLRRRLMVSRSSLR